MDPFRAFSLAGSFVQFVDFGSELRSKSREIYKSSGGASFANKEQKTTLTELLCHNL